jgi:hypothetical protein
VKYVIRVLAVVVIVVALGIILSGCEFGNGVRSSASVAHQIINEADTVCADRGKTANIAWMEGRTDDVVITCQDGTNHYYNG